VLLVLVPTPLIEFRYYILPFLFYRLHIRQPATSPLLGELALNVVINAVTLWLFLAKPFMWADHPNLQRFMW
jgi:alpha-1,2-glucosyltransferase